MSKTITAHTYAAAHTSRKNMGKPSTFVLVGKMLCDACGSRRWRNVYRLVDNDNGLLYIRPRGHAWMLPIRSEN